jgi:hypothetical protein
MNTLNNILNQSFQEELHKYNNRTINTSEAQQVNILFTKLKGITTDCNICYLETKCIQCYQCEFKYCNECLTKIISEFTKCSACNCNLINNYKKLEDKNITLQNTSTNKINARILDYSDYMEFDNDLEYITYINQNNNTNSTNRNNNLDDDLLQIAIANSLTDMQIINNNSNSNDKLKKYIEELENDEILPYNITSLKHHRAIPNFESYYDTHKKILVFTAYDKSLSRIELDYKIFNTKFQSEFRIILIKLLEHTTSSFKKLWNIIHDLIKDYMKQYNKQYNKQYANFHKIKNNNIALKDGKNRKDGKDGKDGKKELLDTIKLLILE